MSKRFFIAISLLIINTSFSYSQQNADYLGVIKLNDTSLISYKIVFTENDGVINGYSITDLGGEHETKSLISGFFNDKENKLTFKESGIIYTKSSITELDFCFVHFTGELKKIDGKKEINGTFKGLYDDGEECINGEIKMANMIKIYKKAKKIDRKIDRNKLVNKEKRDKINLVKDLDTLNMNLISKGEILNVFTKDKSIKLVIYDAGIEDGDIINLSINGSKILNTYTVTKEHKTINVLLKTPQTVIEVEALNVGTSSPNTVRLEITDTKNNVRTFTNLYTGEKAGVTIISN